MLAGLFAGLAMLSKYHGALLFAGAGLFVLLSPRQRFWLATPWPYLAGLVALAVFSPVLIWNAQHHWVSFLFQGARSGAPHLQLVAPLALIGLQSLFLAPWIFFPLAALFLRALWRGPAQEKRFLSRLSRRLPDCPVHPGRALVEPSRPAALGRARLSDDVSAAGARDRDALACRRAWPRRALAAAAAFTLLAAGAVVALPHLPLKMLAGQRDPLIEMLGWDDFARALDSRGWRKDDMFVAATRWFEAGKLDVALHGDPPVLCLSDDPRGFAIVRDPKNFVGRDALIVGQESAAGGSPRAL